MITSEQIIQAVYDATIRHSNIHVFWLEGSFATDTTDQYSDLDLWFDVADGTEKATLDLVAIALESLGELDFVKLEVQPHPQIWYAVFHLKNSSPYLLIDVCVQSHSRNFVFTAGKLDEQFKTVFDKQGCLKVQLGQSVGEMEQQAFKAHLTETIAQKHRVLKMIQRQNLIGALDYYQKYILDPIMELLWLKYVGPGPVLKSSLKKVLPSDLMTELEALHSIRDLTDLEQKVKRAVNFYHKL